MLYIHNVKSMLNNISAFIDRADCLLDVMYHASLRDSFEGFSEAEYEVASVLRSVAREMLAGAKERIESDKQLLALEDANAAIYAEENGGKAA